MHSRFGWIVDGRAHGPDPRCDTSLLSTADGMIIPSLGGLVPGWLLLVPRTRALSYADLEPQTRQSLYDLAQDIGTRYARMGMPVYLEHGASVAKSVVGCGVDQAHLHLVPVEFDLLDQVLGDHSVSWREVASKDPWQSVAPGQEYYLIVQGQRAFVGSPRRAESQYFRKHIARGIGLTEQWDYKGWPNYGNVARTVRDFESAITG